MVPGQAGPEHEPGESQSSQLSTPGVSQSGSMAPHPQSQRLPSAHKRSEHSHIVGGSGHCELSSAATEQAKGEQLVSSQVSQDARVASAQSTSSTPQPQLQTPSPKVSALHHQCGGTSQRVLSSAAIADGHGPFPHAPTAAQSVQLPTLLSGQSRSAAPPPQARELPSP